jgi:hypothetical protein
MYIYVWNYAYTYAHTIYICMCVYVHTQRNATKEYYILFETEIEISLNTLFPAFKFKWILEFHRSTGKKLINWYDGK